MSLFHASTYFEHHVLIVRRSKLYYTASGIITPTGGRPVHGTATYRYYEESSNNNNDNNNNNNNNYNHHHHVPEGLGMFPVSWSLRWSWSLHLFLGRPMFLRPFGLYCSACFGSLFVSILCTCCSHFSWQCFISFTMFCVPVFCLIHWFFFI